MERDITNCLDCGIQLSGRLDKKFCSSICRTSFHNSKNKILRRKTSFGKVESQLKLNRKILSELLRSGKPQVTMKYLIKRKFKPDIFTGVVKENDQETIFHCFDFHIKIRANEKFVIIYRD